MHDTFCFTSIARHIHIHEHTHSARDKIHHANHSHNNPSYAYDFKGLVVALFTVLTVFSLDLYLIKNNNIIYSLCHPLSAYLQLFVLVFLLRRWKSPLGLSHVSTYLHLHLSPSCLSPSLRPLGVPAALTSSVPLSAVSAPAAAAAAVADEALTPALLLLLLLPLPLSLPPSLPLPPSFSLSLILLSIQLTGGVLQWACSVRGVVSVAVEWSWGWRMRWELAGVIWIWEWCFL